MTDLKAMFYSLFKKVLMAEDKKVNYGLIFTLIITALGWGVTFGICQNKIDNNSMIIQEVQARQYIQESNMQEIQKTLSSLDSKMDLLLQGRIKFIQE